VVAGIIVLALLSSSIKDAIWERMWTSGLRTYIATMYVEGTIAAGQTDTFGLPIGYQHNWTLEKIDELIADSNNPDCSYLSIPQAAEFMKAMNFI